MTLPPRKRRWPFVIGGLVLLLALVGGYVYYNPFWLIDRGVNTYMRVHAVADGHVDVDGNRIHYFEAKPTGTGQIGRAHV